MALRGGLPRDGRSLADLTAPFAMHAAERTGFPQHSYRPQDENGLDACSTLLRRLLRFFRRRRLGGRCGSWFSNRWFSSGNFLNHNHFGSGSLGRRSCFGSRWSAVSLGSGGGLGLGFGRLGQRFLGRFQQAVGKLNDMPLMDEPVQVGIQRVQLG